MSKERIIEKMVSIFSLGEVKPPGLPVKDSTKVMFLYDREKNIRKFEVLNRLMPKCLNTELTSWLEKNVYPG